MGGYGLGSLTLALAAVAGAGSWLVSWQVPEPYMDEVFHVPQTQRYCAGRWAEWESKITTFPGLYLVGAAAGRAVHAVQQLLGMGGQQQLCGAAVLRGFNAAMGLACLPLFYHLAAAIDPGRNQSSLLLLAACCFFFPPHFFYTLLYYTDTLSVLCTLGALLATLRARRTAAGALAAAAVLARQTNAVWVCFALGSAVIARSLPSSGGGKAHSDSSTDGIGSSSHQAPAGTAGAQRARQRRRQQQQAGSSSGGLLSLVSEVWQLLQRAWLLRWELAAQLWPLAAVAAAFAAFVRWNGDIVVGDRAHHTPVLHWAQPLYFALSSAAWLAPALWVTPKQLAAIARAAAAASVSSIAAAAAAGGTLVASVARGTLSHPFLLADNRHYTFYLWRRVLNRTPWARYALLPAHAAALCMLGGALAHRRATWRLLFALSTCAVLVPAHLIEPRYFTTPFLLLLLHARTPSPSALRLMLVAFCAVNALTLAVFLFRPFAWPDGSSARFLW